ncbi:sensor histidine kinase [Metabacillus halosaccharovorans]|uniref:ATP-binding protein n=1 Tax=Metabacillus halosaccharovorans TaxID=930124 RepID=UPI00403DCCF2
MRKLIISYLKRHLVKYLVFFLFTSIFAVVLSLYNLPVEPVLYSSIICVYVAIIFILLDFINYYKRHKQLIELRKTITLQVDSLPTARDLIEKDYHDLIKRLYEDKVHIVSSNDQVHSSLQDYFILWAHQIKTPIAAMDLILQSEENEQNKELSIELFKIEQYVEMVLQYLRLGNMSSDLLLKKYSLDELVKQAIRKYAKLFIRKKIQLSLSDLDRNVLTDEKWLVFVIEQLLSNAIKYTKKGSILIYMDPASENTLVIEDTGIGIEEEDLPRVFEKGFTGYNGRSDKKSTGIGLYLCKQILATLGHQVTIQSNVGKGTKVFIEFQLNEMKME